MVAEILIVVPGAQMDVAKQSAQYVARSLSTIGFKVREQISLCENVRQLQQAVSAGLARSHVLVSIGGMGQESGFLAKTTMAQGLGLPLEHNSEALAAIRNYCHRTGEPYEQEDNALAQLPQGCTVFPGTYSKIPGCVISSQKQHIIMLPESHQDIMPMFNRYVSPYLGGTATSTITRIVRTYGVGEQKVKDMLGTRMLSAPNPAVTVQKEHNEVLIRVSAHAESSQKAAALCTPLLRTIVDKMGDAAYGLDVDSLQSALVTKLNKKDLDVAIAEAGTGGILTRAITETEGGQDVLRYSVAVDDDEAKIEKLGLSKKLLKKRGGGISEYAAVAMADAARTKVHTGIGIAVCAATEFSATKKCPPGMVYIAVCDAEYVYVKKLVVGDGDAADDVIVDAALSRALNMARLFVDYLPRRYTGAIPLIEALDGKTVTDQEDYFDFDEEEYEEEEKQGGGFLSKVRKFVFVLALLVFLGSAGYLGKFLWDGYQAKLQAEELKDMFVFGEDEADAEISEDYPKGFSAKFVNLWNQNRDVRGFIRIEGTSVEYPVVQSTDNDYYLRRDFYKQSSQHGVPYFDYRVKVEKPSDNMVVYGHNMTDGQIFGELMNYKKLEYYQEHPIIEFSTVYRDAKYKVFSIYITNAYENQGHVFDYYNFIDADDNEQFAEYIKQLQYRSLLNVPVDVEPGDQLLTLSTCSYEFTDMRTVIVARKVRKGEEETVDVSKAEENPNPLYPDIWYNKFGGSKPEGIDSYWRVRTSGFVDLTNSESEDETASQAPMAATAATRLTATPVSAKAPVTLSEEPPPLETAAADQDEQSRLDELSRLEEQSSRIAREAQVLAEQEAARLTAEERSRTTAEAEAEAARLSAEEESRIAAESEAEAARLAAEEQSRKAEQSEAEASRLAAEEQSRQAAEAAEQSRQQAERQESETNERASAAAFSAASADVGQLRVTAGGSEKSGDALDIVAAIVQTEVGSTFHVEAIKAQAVAAYSFILHNNNKGTAPNVYLSDNVSDKVKDAVAQVLGQAVYYGGSVAFTPYHATSAGSTTSSSAVWGGGYPYLTPVDSSVDKDTAKYKVEKTMTRSEVADLISGKLSIQPSGDPGGWFEILDYEDGGYNGNMSVCGQTTSGGKNITGRMLREGVLGLRSACFTVDYDAGSETFTFTTYGYGHGVGLSQTGANAYANQGWDYVQILTHYYPGTSVQ